MNFKAAKVISPVLERREKVTNRKICSGDLKNKSYLRDEGIRDLKETLEEVQGDIDSKHPKDKQYINWKNTKGLEVYKYRKNNTKSKPNSSKDT